MNTPAPHQRHRAVDLAVDTWRQRFGDRPLPKDREALTALLIDEAGDDANVVLDGLRFCTFETFVALAQGRDRP